MCGRNMSSGASGSDPKLNPTDKLPKVDSKIVEKTGDVFSTDATLIAHGVNCGGAYNAGIAKQVRNKFPKAYTEYMRKFVTEGWKPGQIQIIDNIANLAIQQTWGSCGVHVDYNALRTCIEELFNYCETNKIEKLAMPRIGCGLAGGDWEKVKKILEELSQNKDLIIEVYDGKGVA